MRSSDARFHWQALIFIGRANGRAPKQTQQTWLVLFVLSYSCQPQFPIPIPVVAVVVISGVTSIYESERERERK